MPLPARHMARAMSLLFIILSASCGVWWSGENGEGNVSVFYLHDSGYYAPEVWEYFRNLPSAADLISIDSTSGDIDTQFKGGHLGVPDVLRVKKEMEAIGMVDAHTHFVMNHFSHNGHLLHHQLEALAGLLALKYPTTVRVFIFNSFAFRNERHSWRKRIRLRNVFIFMLFEGFDLLNGGGGYRQHPFLFAPFLSSVPGASYP